jgi:hypothetical protein
MAAGEVREGKNERTESGKRLRQSPTPGRARYMPTVGFNRLGRAQIEDRGDEKLSRINGMGTENM